MRKLYFAWVLVLAFCAGGYSYSAAECIRGEHFNICYYDGCDLAKLANKLQASHFISVDTFLSGKTDKDIKSLIAKLFDSIYLEVSDILDIHVYNLKSTIDIQPDKTRVADILEGYLGRRIDIPSFYFHTKNTIYVSYSDISLGILAHEMAHAIISHYFVVPPPAKTQEILTGYVEYSIRKATGTLPGK